MSKTTCIVLAGGLGTRLRAAVANKPKCLAPIGDTTVIALHLESLIKQGFECFILSLGYLAEQFSAEIDRLTVKHPNCTFKSIVEPHPLGTGGAIYYAMDRSNISEAVVTNGDTISVADLNAFQLPLANDPFEALRIGLVHVSDRTRYGGVVLNEVGLVTDFSEKKQAGQGLISAGIYRVRREIFSHFNVGDKFSIETEVLVKMVQTNPVSGVVLNAPIVDIGLPEDYKRFCETYLDRS